MKKRENSKCLWIFYLVFFRLYVYIYACNQKVMAQQNIERETLHTRTKSNINKYEKSVEF